MQSTAEVLLNQSKTMLAPWVQALVRQGITYPQFVAEFKQVFFDAARAELEKNGQRLTDSAVSVLSGLHRKDVRSLGLSVQRPEAPAMTLASQIVTRWLSERRYRDGEKKLRPLPRHGQVDSFEALVGSVSRDIHPRTALEELVRLGAVTLQDDHVHLDGAAFVPRKGLFEMTELLSQNVADHIAAGAHNIETSGSSRFLEQSVFAAGLTAESVEMLGEVARAAWALAFEQVVDGANRSFKADSQYSGVKHRMRFGAYFYSAPSAGE